MNGHVLVVGGLIMIVLNAVIDCVVIKIGHSEDRSFAAIGMGLVIVGLSLG